MNRKSVFLLSALVSMLGPCFARANSPSTSATSTTVRQLDTLHDQIAVLKEELQIAKLKAGIKDAGKAGPRTSASTSSGFPAFSYGPPALPRASTVVSHHEPMPRIVSIDGRGSQLSAVLTMPDGGEVVVTPGMGLGDGLTVHDITAAGVRIIHGGKLLPLSFIGDQRRMGALSQAAVPPVNAPLPFPPVQTLPAPQILPGASQ